MAKDNINQDMALDDATDLAFDIDVHLREHSSTYNSEHTEVMEAQENIADDNISGNFDNVKGLLTRYATQNEDFFKRLFNITMDDYPRTIYTNDDLKGVSYEVLTCDEYLRSLIEEENDKLFAFLLEEDM